VFPAAAASGADPGVVRSWHAAAVALLADAVDLTIPDIRDLEPAIRADLERLPLHRTIATQPVHGDLHVGQILEWAGGLAVIDFDGNPALGESGTPIGGPIERDIAQMLASLDHVGRIVEHRRDAGPDRAVDEWILVSRDAFLAAYGPVDPERLAGFEAEQELRELAYAARFLPRWRYAPVSTLRARYGRLKAR